ncbi:sigma-70 family RNA polymerase sigma factor [Egibacter rhizosphaerae]|uniref:Sigma-70 family RNA polymerase sigma factor n=1 Tax=Egibacter rhizosphaerae TaxID=1670831 RepID=A0A411YIU3_9ACTN|nr:sigma-70 family RNA polymerase sigma factor [Egibacter rhizosphaerae]QBI21214.1 sigma-70 family RNA polymerase sigma factor [Egibacter rhizosphaerae]
MSGQEEAPDPASGASGAVEPGTAALAEPSVREDPRPSWDEVAETYGPRVYRMAYHLTGDADEAADLAQDVFVRVYRNLHRYRPGAFDGWLYKIAKNLFLDRVRRRQRVRMQAFGEDGGEATPSGEPGPADVVERRTLEARLESGLAALPPEWRLAVVLCDIEGLAYEEISRVTGWPVGTVRSRIHRGRRRLREHLEASGPQSSEEPAAGASAGSASAGSGEGSPDA